MEISIIFFADQRSHSRFKARPQIQQSHLECPIQAEKFWFLQISCACSLRY